jgi:hypothetical protein
MELSWDDMAIHKNDYEAGKLLAGWRWLVDESFSVILPTVLGDLFLERCDGTIWFLDTCGGQLEQVAKRYDDFKSLLQDQQRLRDWFATDLLADLLTSGLRRNAGECFSPTLPPILGGKIEPSNFHACSLLAHQALLGPLHEKVRQLPPGTPITDIEIEWT